MKTLKKRMLSKLKYILWVIIKLITIIISYPFLIMRFIGVNVSHFLTEIVMKWEDDVFDR